MAFIERDCHVNDPRVAAYLLATAHYETRGTFLPQDFEQDREYVEARFQNREDLGNNGPEDAWNYRPRGYIRLVGRRWYEAYSSVTGEDLLSCPEMALNLPTAYRVLQDAVTSGRMTGKPLSRYIRGNDCNFLFARQTLNKMRDARPIAESAARFLRHYQREAAAS